MAGARATADDTGGSTGHEPSLMRDTDYGWWFGADTAGQLSASISSFALPLIALAVTHSAAQAALLESIMSCMNAVFVIPGGLVQDRFDRRKLLLIWSMAGVLLFAVAGFMQFSGGLDWVALVVLSVILGIRSGLLGNTSSSMLRGVVPDEELPQAMAITHGRDAVINIAGSPISGVLMGFGYAVPLFVSSVLSAFGGGLGLKIHRYWRHGKADTATDDPCNGSADATQTLATPTAPMPVSAQVPPAVASSMVRSLKQAIGEAFEGLRWLCRAPFQRRLAFASALCNGGINGLLLITQMHVQSATHSSLTAAMVLTIGSVGMLIGAVASPKLVARIPGGPLTASFFVLFPLGSLGLALSQHLVWLQGAFLFISMLLLPAGNAVMGGFMAMLVSKEKQGRFGAAMTLCSLASYAVLSWLAGLIMERFGYTASALVLAVILALGAALVLSMPQIMKLPLPQRWEDHIEHYRLDRF